ncbi:sorting nexin-30-like [Phymastichus coffea]|uniref:sorting nexin-30-like n=1 Tax=Phymastichus coffea TaxID=108790 RepID=UPI00273B119A|nr:sorting nexin-30-like [Phymastichus coffea]XP_058790695.1 sorting nexin-30-like [Phymastichus coffea]
MMTPTDNETAEAEQKLTADSSAVLEVSLMLTMKQQDETASNCSTSVEGSVVASPSIESFSTFPDQDMSECNTDLRDLQVKVDNPQKHVETLETYITFRITTKSTRSEFEEGEYVVRRRYNDFIWLRQKLVESYPAHIIPPMPGKHSLLAQLDRYSKEFIIARMKLLHIFLNRIANHPILSCDKSLQIFLTVKPTEFLVHRKNRSSVMNKVSDSIPSITSSVNLKQRHLEFEQARDYCTSLSEKLITVDKISRRIQKERQDYLMELNQFHPIFTQWASTEPELETILQAIASAIEGNTSAHQKLLDSTVNDEREYVAYVDAVKDALNRRDAIQMDYELTAEDLNKRRAEREQIIESSNGPAPRWDNSFWKSESNTEKLDRLSQTIPRKSKAVEVLQDRLECANENLRSDLERWNAEKRTDLKNLLIAMADQQIAHYQQCTNAWEEALSIVKTNGNNETDSASTVAKVLV